MDRLRALAMFKAVVDKGAFARAAAELNVSCALVSRTVQELELLLGVQLLQRSTRRIALTEVGQEVLRRAADLLDSYDELAALSSLSASEPSGVVRLAAPASYARRYLGPALAAFMAKHPKIRVDLRMREGPVDLVSRDVDLALCLHCDLRPSLIARSVGVAEVGLFASPAYLALSGEPSLPNDLLAHNCLTCEDMASGSNWRFTRAADGESIDVPVKGTMRSSHADVLVGASIHGAGVVLLPAFMVEDATSLGQLRRLLPAWHCEPLAIHLAYGSRRHQPMRVRILIDHLVEALGSAGRQLDAPPLNLDRLLTPFADRARGAALLPALQFRPSTLN